MKFRKICGVILTTSTLVVVAIAWTAWPRSRPLARFSRRIHPRFYTIPSAWDYRYWLSNREQIEIGYTQVNIARPGEAPRIKLMSQAWRIDMGSGQAYRLKELNDRLIEERRNGHEVSIHSWKISPDRKWIVYVEGNYRNPSWYVAISTDGSQVLRWPRAANKEFVHSHIFHGPMMIYWGADSKRWVGIEHGDDPFGYENAHTYYVDKPQEVALLSPPTLEVYGKELGLTSKGRLLVASGLDPRRGYFSPGQNVLLAELNLDDSKSRPISHTVVPPRGAAVDCMALSPCGDKLAWLFTSHQSPPRIRFLEKPLALLGIRNRDILSLWVSRSDGSEMREIGHLDWNPKTGSGALAWAPEEKRVSFWAENDVWVTPID